MRIIICDDNEAIREQLKRYINNYFEIVRYFDYQIDEFVSGDELLKDNGPLDIIFLDIEMPGIDGIVTGNRIRLINPKSIIIIVTSFWEYLDEAMKFSVFRYLSKPIDKHRLYRNLEDALETYIHTHSHILIDTDWGCIRLDTDSIIMIETGYRNIKITTIDNVYEVSESLSEFMQKIDFPCFYQCHRSFIINLGYVTNITKDTVFLYDGKYQAYLSRRKYAECKSKLMLYLEKNR